MGEGLDYGPLAALAGTWKGDKGRDVAPDPGGKEENPYYETLVFEKVGDVRNAEKQVLVALRYRQVVSRKSDDKVFHNEVGFLLWDAGAKTVMQTLTIPRGVALVAGGRLDDPRSGTFEVKAGDADWPIAQSPFMRENAKTVAFTHTISVVGDSLTYSETTTVDIYGRRFEHTDGNTLARQK
ncbi:MAG: FABP family protein [Elusimicrobia bacterium]|nr:FABP family protein [Elusimicrobiota bacterium]